MFQRFGNKIVNLLTMLQFMLYYVTQLLISDHAFVKKWGVLENVGEENGNISAGYLQVDLSIVSTFEPPSPAILQINEDDIIEE